MKIVKMRVGKVLDLTTNELLYILNLNLRTSTDSWGIQLKIGRIYGTQD